MGNAKSFESRNTAVRRHWRQHHLFLASGGGVSMQLRKWASAADMLQFNRYSPDLHAENMPYRPACRSSDCHPGRTTHRHAILSYGAGFEPIHRAIRMEVGLPLDR